MTHFEVICPNRNHLTTCFALEFKLQRRGHLITLLNVVDVQDKVVAAFEFRAFDETKVPGAPVRLANWIGRLSGMVAVKETIKVVEQFRVILQQAPAIIKTDSFKELISKE